MNGSVREHTFINILLFSLQFKSYNTLLLFFNIKISFFLKKSKISMAGNSKIFKKFNFYATLWYKYT